MKINGLVLLLILFFPASMSFAGAPLCKGEHLDKRARFNTISSGATLCSMEEMLSCKVDSECSLLIGRCHTIKAVNTKYIDEFKKSEFSDIGSCFRGNGDQIEDHKAKCIKNQCSVVPHFKK